MQSNFGGKNFIQCTNLTEIQPGHNIATFESSKILIQEVTASISAADSLNLKRPEIIKIRPNARIHFRKSGWPFIRHNRTLEMPLISKNALKQKAAITQLNSTENLIRDEKLWNVIRGRHVFTGFKFSIFSKMPHSGTLNLSHPHLQQHVYL